MKRSVLIGAATAGVLAAAAAGWFIYQRRLIERDICVCYTGSDPDACIRNAVRAFKAGQITQYEEHVMRYCTVTRALEVGGTQAMDRARPCLVQTQRQVETLASMK